MRKILVAALFLLVGRSIQAQQYPVFSQYYLTPYLYNPAAVANSGRTEVNLLYRQQWSGIEDAPTTQAFTFEYPTKKHLYFGANFYHDKTILLNTSSLMLGLAYRVDLAKNQSVKFGISSGVGFNNFDLANADYPDDEALRSVLNNTSFLNGQFGIFYQAGNFKLGASLPQLYKYSAVDTVKFQAFELDPVKNYILTASYAFKFRNGVLGLEPFAMYRKDELLPEIIEAGAMLNVKDILVVGGSYRKDYGASGYFGINLKKNLSFGYAYEFATSQVAGFGNGTHEFSLKFRFGGKKEKAEKPLVAATSLPSMYMGAEQSDKTTSTPEKQNQQTGGTTIAAPVETNVTPKNNEKSPEKIESTPEPTGSQSSINALNNSPSASSVSGENGFDNIADLTVEKEKAKTTPNVQQKQYPPLDPGFYVVLGAFEIEQNAVLFTRQLNGRGITSNYRYIPDRNLFYVYASHTQDENKAQKLRREFSKMKDYSDVWVFEVK